MSQVGSHRPLSCSFQSSSVFDYRNNKQNTEICTRQGTLRQPSTLPVSGFADPTQPEPEPWGWAGSMHHSHAWQVGHTRCQATASGISLCAGFWVFLATSQYLCHHQNTLLLSSESTGWGSVLVFYCGLVWFDLDRVSSGLTASEDDLELLTSSCLYLPKAWIADMCHHACLGQYCLKIGSNKQ